MLEFTSMPSTFPSKTMDISKVILWIKDLWSLVFSGLMNVKFKFGNYTFSILSLFIALMVLSIVSVVVLNVAKSSAQGAEISVSRANQTSAERKKFGRPH